MNIKKDLSPNFTKADQSVAQYGEPRIFKFIVLHWWDDPSKKPTLKGTVDHLKDSTLGTKRVSAHYVVSDTTIIQLVEENNIAWHAKQANPQSIGIEIDPQFPGKTLETVGELVADICERRNISLNTDFIKGHKFFVNTACPGTLDIPKVIEIAKSFGGDPCANLKEELEALKVELVEMRESRDKWKQALKEAEDKSVKEIADKNKTIESQQKQISQLNESLTLAARDKDMLLEQKNAAEGKLEPLEKKLKDQEKILETLRGKHTDLINERDALKAKIKLKLSQTSWKDFITAKLGGDI